MRIIKGIILLILAAALTIGCFWIIDSYPNIIHQTNTVDRSTVDVDSDLTERIYGLGKEVSDTKLENYETGVNKEVSAYVQAHSNSSSGGNYYYSDDDGDWSSGGESTGGYWVSGEVDDTEYNICHNCGTKYTGTGDCPVCFPNGF